MSKFWGTPAHKIAMSYYLNGDIANNGWSPNKREVLWGEAGQVYETQISRALKCSAKCKLNLSSHLKSLHSHCRSRIWRTEGCSEWSCTGTRRSRKSAAGKRFLFQKIRFAQVCIKVSFQNFLTGLVQFCSSSELSKQSSSPSHTQVWRKGHIRVHIPYIWSLPNWP